MDANVRSLVRSRAQNRCEYCRIHQDADFVYTFHVEHVIAKQHGGTDDPGNLALACHHCNLHKGPNLSGIDPETQHTVLLFHPRQDDWAEHFALNGPLVVGLTAVRRATVRLLHMNALPRLELRAHDGA